MYCCLFYRNFNAWTLNKSVHARLNHPWLKRISFVFLKTREIKNWDMYITTAVVVTYLGRHK